MKPDLDCEVHIDAFIASFYSKILKDPVLAPIFLDVAEVDLEQHLPHIRDYWCKLLLGRTDYRRHTMNIHRRLHAKKGLTTDDFKSWLTLFSQSLEEGYEGPKASRAQRVATAIAGNMLHAVTSVDPPG